MMLLGVLMVMSDVQLAVAGWLKDNYSLCGFKVVNCGFALFVIRNLTVVDLVMTDCALFVGIDAVRGFGFYKPHVLDCMIRIDFASELFFERLGGLLDSAWEV